MLFDKTLDDAYYYMAKNYFSDQLILSHLQDGNYDLAKDIINKNSKKYGGAVAVICMEKGCQRAQDDASQ